MAKHTEHVCGDFDKIVDFIHHELWQQSMSLSLEETYETSVADKRVEMRSYERYSAIGHNRVSLNVLFIETEDGADICGTSTGGSQAIFWKLNSFGEYTFLETLIKAIQAWNTKVEA